MDSLENYSKYFYKNNQCFMFITNSPEFTIEYEISNDVVGEFPHVGVATREGLTISYKKDGIWFNVDTYVREYTKTINMRTMIDSGEEYELVIYGPVLTTLSKLSVKVPNNYKIAHIEKKPKILVVGGIYSFGIGCTTPGIMFSNILGRKLNCNVHHLTFNNNNYLKDVDLFLKNNSLAHYDYIILELDYLYQDDEVVSKYLLNIINRLKSHSNLIIGWSLIPPNKSYKLTNLNELFKHIDDKILLCNFQDIYNDTKDMCISNDFINDAGNILIFKKLFNIIRSR